MEVNGWMGIEEIFGDVAAAIRQEIAEQRHLVAVHYGVHRHRTLLFSYALAAGAPHRARTPTSSKS